MGRLILSRGSDRLILTAEEMFRNMPKWVVTEVGVRIGLLCIFLLTEELKPYHRIIQPEEAWLYRFPNKPSIIPSELLWVILLIATFSVVALLFVFTSNFNLAVGALGVPSLALPLNGIITNLVKVSVGRPRPDYLNRCYGDQYHGVTDFSMPCSGNDVLVADGRKSFPSGHSSMSFCGFGFLFLLLAAQLKVFSSNRGRSMNLLISLLPILFATMVAISRTCDYHHHWQDISVGSFLGFVVVFIVYRQYFPSLTSDDCDKLNIRGHEDFVDSRKPSRNGSTSSSRKSLLSSDDSPTSVKIV